MLIEHNGFVPQISESTFVAANATVCGNVKIGNNCRILYGASLIAEGGTIEIGDNVVVLENAVLRSTEKHNLKIGNTILIGPNTHVVGCEIEDRVFVATGASVFHGAKLESGAEVRINAVVHIKTLVKRNQTVPIGWIAVGNPAQIFSPEKHDEIWKIQKELNFPSFVYGVERGDDTMDRILNSMLSLLESHKNDREISQ